MPEYQSILNNDVKRELGGKSPFEVYYNRKSNEVVQPIASSEEESEGDEAVQRPKVWPELSATEIKALDNRRELLEKFVTRSNERSAKQMVNEALKKNPLPVYELKEKVLLRLPSSKKTKKAPRNRMVVFGRVLKRKVMKSK